MWTKLDDSLLDHRKLLVAGAIVGPPHGTERAVALFIDGLLWANKHLSNGHLPREVVAALPHVKDALTVARALVKVRLWESNSGNGFVIHDYRDYNPLATEVAAKRRRDRARKLRRRANVHAGKKR